MLSVNFDGHELNEFFGVLKGFTAFDGADFAPVFGDKGYNSIGDNFLYTKKNKKTISMPFLARDDLAEKYDKLEKILDVSEPKRLIFGHMPDRMFYAIPSGTLNFEEIIFLGKGTINWVIPDGLAHATTETAFTASPNADGVLEATIVNNGTADVPISYEITHNADNGYIGIASANGAMEFGKRDEADGADYQENDILLNSGSFSAWKAVTTGANPQNPDNAINGTLAEKIVGGRNVLYLSNAGTGARWHGGLREYTLPEDSQGETGSKNWYCFFNAAFETGKVSETGAFTLSFIDKQGKAICAYTLYKTTTNSNSAVADFWIGGDNPRTWKSTSFTPSMFSNDNFFNRDEGYCDMRKMDDLFEFYWRGTRYGIHVPELKDKEVVKIQIYIAQIGSRSLDAGSFLGMNFLRGVYFQKLNVDKWQDLPNRYGNGTVFTVEGDTKKPYSNGILALDDEIVGTNYFKAPPGTSKVQFYFSSFSDPVPDITATIREAWL